MFDFLAGLNEDLDEVQGRILGKESMLCTSWWSVYWSKKGREWEKCDVGRKEGFEQYPSGEELRTGRRVCCDHCKKLGHTKNKY